MKLPMKRIPYAYRDESVGWRDAYVVDWHELARMIKAYHYFRNRYKAKQDKDGLWYVYKKFWYYPFWVRNSCYYTTSAKAWNIVRIKEGSIKHER